LPLWRRVVGQGPAGRHGPGAGPIRAVSAAKPGSVQVARAPQSREAGTIHSLAQRGGHDRTSAGCADHARERRRPAVVSHNWPAVCVLPGLFKRYARQGLEMMLRKLFDEVVGPRRPHGISGSCCLSSEPYCALRPRSFPAGQVVAERPHRQPVAVAVPRGAC